MEMHQVRYFLAVARTLNFTRAAEDCNVSQPSLTRAVQKLEDELGGPLLRRERSLTHLTELGQLMLPHLERTYDAAQTAKELAKGVRRAETAPLRLGVAHCVESEALVETLRDLDIAIPGLEITLIEGSSGDLIDRALKGDVDLLVIGLPDAEVERLDPWPLYKLRYKMMVGVDHRLAARDEVDLNDFVEENWIDDGCEGTARLRKAAEIANVELRFKHRVESSRHAQNFVLAGLGSGIHGGRGDPDRRLKLLAFADPTMTVDVVMAGIAGRRRSLAADALVRAARARGWETV